ncbi:MAG: hypothetical protein JW820_06730 [Spirochaetales bacterium]|nr:hypothetical protein [Spirochaetales bacterium]
METAIYLGTAALTILWSVWIYRVWSQRARLRESDAGRFYHIIAPSGYFVLLALAGWERARVIRLDLIGAVIYDGIIVLCAIALLVAGALKHIDYRRSFRRLLVLYNLLAVLLLVALYLVKFFPPLLIRVTALVQELTALDFFRFAWVGLDPESHQQDLISMANKVLIALLSYIPVSLARALYVSRQMSRQRREMHDELGGMKRRIEALERRLAADGQQPDKRGAPQTPVDRSRSGGSV